MAVDPEEEGKADDGTPFLDDIFSERVDWPEEFGGGHFDAIAPPEEEAPEEKSAD